MKYLSVPEIEYVSHRLAVELMHFDEPIPDFKTRFPRILEQCIAAPQQTFDKKELYPDLESKSAILFYLMIKNHPFQNGNKRIAVMTLLFFLYKNGKWFRTDNQELYNFAVWVAESNPKVKNPTLEAIKQFLKAYIIDKKDGNKLI